MFAFRSSTLTFYQHKNVKSSIVLHTGPFSDSEGDVVLEASPAALCFTLLCGGFHTQPSLGFSESRFKNTKDPVRGRVFGNIER